MSDEVLTRLDGNAIAGSLRELFGAEMTTLARPCQACRRVSAVGAYHLYLGAGSVLRCPHCGSVALTITTLLGRQVVSLHGTWTVVLERD